MTWRTAQRFSVATVLAVHVALAACSGAGQGDLEQARGAWAAGNHRVAMIQIKNILQKDPNNKDARILLAQVHLAMGDGASAEKEIRKARELGVDDVEATALLGQSLLHQRAYDRILDEIRPAEGQTAAIQAGLKVARGYAYLGRNDMANAEREFAQAQELDPQADEAFLGLARTKIQVADYEAANEQIDRAIAVAKDARRAWLLKGELELARQQYGEAERVYQKAIGSHDPEKMDFGDFQAWSGLARAQLAQRKVEDAAASVDTLLNAVPNHPLPKYLRALVAYEAKDYGTAETYLHQVQTQLPDDMPSLLLLGAVHYAQGNLEQANTALSRYLATVPANLHARKLLGAVRLQLHKPEEALNVLLPASQSEGNDGQLLAMIGEAAAARGDVQMQAEYLQKAAAVEPQQSQLRLDLARLRLQQGAFDQAIQDLVAIKGDGEAQAKALMIYAYLRKAQFTTAREQALQLRDQYSDKPYPLAILGTVEWASGNLAKARDYLSEARRLDARYWPAALIHGHIAFQDGKVDEASGMFHQVLNIDPANVQALLGLAAVAEKQQNREQAVSWLEKARGSNAGAVPPRLALAQHYLAAGKVQQALDVAREAAAAQPRDPAVLFFLGRSQLAAELNQDARQTLETLVRVLPDAPEGHFELANAQVKQKDYRAAKSELQRALELNRNFLKAQVALVYVAIALGEHDEALAQATDIQNKHKELAVGYALQGDVYASQGRYKDAQGHYATALKKEPSGVHARKLGNAYAKAGDYERAHGELEQWLAKHSDDHETRMLFAVNLHEAGAIERAKGQYRQILSVQPDNVVALNNLASLESESNPQQAVGYAEKAYALAPGSAAVADTFGWSLVRAGRVQEGLKLLEDAAVRTADPQVQYHLAAAWAKSGSVEKARNKLRDVLSAPGEFADKAAAQRLYDSL